MFCSQCGGKIHESAKFCIDCGEKATISANNDLDNIANISGMVISTTHIQKNVFFI